MSEKEIVLKANHIVKQFPASGGRTLTACSDVNLKVYKGKTLGIVGESGCGKSTFVRMVMAMDKPTSGEILYRDQDITKMSGQEIWRNRQNMQMVFQDPLASFNPKMKIVDILTEPLMNYGRLKRKEKEKKAAELLEMVELPADFMYRFPHNMSGGQRQRISIARALSLEPEILVCDEATSALDVSIQRTVIELLVRLQREKKISMIFICHDLALIRSFAHQIAVMYLGNIVEVLDGENVSEKALHPYTRALLGAQFSIHMDPAKKIESIESEAPSPLAVPKGCPFQNRCEFCMQKCRSEKPMLFEVEPGHEVACHRYQ
ncbi:MAG: ABC transporter ATP-binding protein [Candidatus Limivivens sp.]|nr:ABC transporter ATP-binding protein [Candidatus Limivivens sp.]